MRRENQIGERDWSKRPLFGVRRRRYGHWLLLMLLLSCGAVMVLYPKIVHSLLTPLLG